MKFCRQSMDYNSGARIIGVGISRIIAQIERIIRPITVNPLPKSDGISRSGWIQLQSLITKIHSRCASFLLE